MGCLKQIMGLRWNMLDRLRRVQRQTRDIYWPPLRYGLHSATNATRRYPWGIQRLVSTHPFPVGGEYSCQSKTQSLKSWPNVHFLGGGGGVTPDTTFLKYFSGGTQGFLNTKFSQHNLLFMTSYTCLLCHTIWLCHEATILVAYDFSWLNNFHWINQSDTIK